MKVSQSCPTLCNPHGLCPGNSPGQNTGLDSLSLLQEIFPIQGSNPGLLQCRWILYQLSHKGSPRILEWAAYPFSSGSSWPRNQTGVSCIAGGFFTNWAIREVLSPVGEMAKVAIKDKWFPLQGKIRELIPSGLQSLLWTLSKNREEDVKDGDYTTALDANNVN